MNDQHCYQCDAYRIQIEQLRKQNERLRKENKKLKNLVNRIGSYCQQLAHITRQTLEKRSGVQRSVWSYNKAAYQTAKQILELLRTE